MIRAIRAVIVLVGGLPMLSEFGIIVVLGIAYFLGYYFDATQNQRALRNRPLNLKQLEDRFLRYVQIDTQSKEDSPEAPSTAKQFDLLRLLVDELQDLGAQEVELTETGYVLATVPATISTNTSRPIAAGSPSSRVLRRPQSMVWRKRSGEASAA